MMVWKMIFFFQGCILSFHVNFPGHHFGTAEFLLSTHNKHLHVRIVLSLYPLLQQNRKEFWGLEGIQDYLAKLQYFTNLGPSLK